MIDNAPECYVMSPSIQGRGLFAGRTFQIGEIIIDFSLFRKDFYKIRYDELNDYQIKYNWYIQIDEDHCLTFDRFSKFSYLNHSRTPNSKWLINDLLVVAERQIYINEEITIDYRIKQRPTRKEFPYWI